MRQPLYMLLVIIVNPLTQAANSLPPLGSDLIEVVRQSPDHMHEPKVGKICSKA